jgi:hypothetical protein
MADISMCSGEGCRIKNYCKRFTSPPDLMWQSYILPEVDKKGWICEMFMRDESAIRYGNRDVKKDLFKQLDMFGGEGEKKNKKNKNSK